MDMNVPEKFLQSQSDPGTFTNGAPKSETSMTETSLKQPLVIELDDEPDPVTRKWKSQIDDPNNPYCFQENLCRDKLQKLRDGEKMDDDSLNAFLNIVRIESGKPVIVVSSYYSSVKSRKGLKEITYHGKLENFEVLVMPIFIKLSPGSDTGASASSLVPVTVPDSALDSASSACHWVLGIYKCGESVIYYYDSLGMQMTYETDHGLNIVLKEKYQWVSEKLMYIVEYITQSKIKVIEAVPLDSQLHNSTGHSSMRKINKQHDYINCGFHVALIAESFLMNNEEVFLEKLDIAAERKRIVDILFGLLEFRYIPREILRSPRDVDLGQKMEQLHMNASSPTLKTLKTTTTNMGESKSREYLWKLIPEINAQPNSNFYDKNHAEIARVLQKLNIVVLPKEESLSMLVKICLLFWHENTNKKYTTFTAELIKEQAAKISEVLGNDNFALSDEDINDFMKRNDINDRSCAVRPTTILNTEEGRRIPTRHSTKTEMPTAENDTEEDCCIDMTSNENNSGTRSKKLTNKKYCVRSFSNGSHSGVPPKRYRQEVSPKQEKMAEKAKVNCPHTANGQQQKFCKGTENLQNPEQKVRGHPKTNVQRKNLATTARLYRRNSRHIVPPKRYRQEVSPNLEQVAKKAETNRSNFSSAIGQQHKSCKSRGKSEKPNPEVNDCLKTKTGRENLAKNAIVPQETINKIKNQVRESKVSNNDKVGNEKENHGNEEHFISYEQLDRKIQTDKEAIEYLQNFHVFPKAGEVKCANGLAKHLYGSKTSAGNIRWAYECNSRKGKKQQQGLRVNSWLSHTKKPLPDLLRILHCWSRQMPNKTIHKKVKGSGRKVVEPRVELIRKACAWHVYIRNQAKKIGVPGSFVEVDVKMFSQHWVLGIVCRKTDEKWLVLVPNVESQTVIPLIEQRAHPKSTIVAGELISSLNLEGHFPANWRISQSDNIANPENAQAIHTQAIERAWAGLEEMVRINRGICHKAWPLRMSEWLWRDEVARKERADPFEEILKTIAEFWPPGAETHLPIPEDIQKLMEKKSIRVTVSTKPSNRQAKTMNLETE